MSLFSPGRPVWSAETVGELYELYNERLTLRRRFAFIELHPDEPPVRDVLAEWAGNADSDDRPALPRALNEAMGEEDRDFKIGPAYLMRDEAATPKGLERIWQYDLLPLLEGYYYGRLGRSQVHQRFGLRAVRTRASREGARTAKDISS